MARKLNPEEADVFNRPAGTLDHDGAEAVWQHLTQRVEEPLDLPDIPAVWIKGLPPHPSNS